MIGKGRRIRVVRPDSADGSLELVYADPHPRLAAHVMTYCGYREITGAPMRRRELPWPGVVVIFDFGPTLRILDPTTGATAGEHGRGFVAGLHTRYALTETAGAQSGLQMNLTPIGARQLCGMSMHVLADHVVKLEDAFGAVAGSMADALREASDWRRRFDLLDRFIAQRLADAPTPCRLAAAGWRRLEAAAGRLPIGALAAELDCSAKHLIAVFREQFGLTPKSVARILRFHNAIRLYDSGDCAGWADVACAAGYSDQAHLANEFQRFAGASPRTFAEVRIQAENAALPG